MAVVKRTRKVRGGDRQTDGSEQADGGDMKHTGGDGPEKRRHANRCWVSPIKAGMQLAGNVARSWIQCLFYLIHRMRPITHFAQGYVLHDSQCAIRKTMNREAESVWRGFYAIQFLRWCQLKPFSNIEVEAFLSFIFLLQHCVTGANKIGWKINPCPSEKPSNALDLNTEDSRRLCCHYAIIVTQ